MDTRRRRRGSAATLAGPKFRLLDVAGVRAGAYEQAVPLLEDHMAKKYSDAVAEVKAMAFTGRDPRSIMSDIRVWVTECEGEVAATAAAAQAKAESESARAAAPKP